ncbi:MAG: hypothetical protein ACTTH8_00885 [Treponema sp.]
MNRKIFILFLFASAASCYAQFVQQNQITVEKVIEIYDSGNKEQARKMFLSLSQRGDFNADFELFYRYLNTPEDSYKYLRNAAVNGHEKAMKYFLETTVYCAETFKRSNPKEALKVYKKYLKKTGLENSKHSINTLDFLTKCAEPPELDSKTFCKKYNLFYNDEDIEKNPYYIWQLAEEASRENSRFGKPDPQLILQLIICGGIVPAEFTLAVEDFYGFYKKNEVHEFRIDNYVTSGYGLNFCAIREKNKNNEYLKKRVSSFQEKIKNENRGKFHEAVTSYFNFVDQKIWAEEGHDGSGYIAWAIESSNKQKEEFLDIIEQMQEIISHNSTEDINDLISKYTEIKEKIDALIGDGQIEGPKFTITLADIKKTEILWQSYKNSMIEFVKNQFGVEASRNISKWIYQKRIENLMNIVELYYDYN